MASSEILPTVASWANSTSSHCMVSTGMVSLLEILSSIRDSHEMDNLDLVAFFLTKVLLLNVHIPPSLEIDLELTTEVVCGALWIIFNPVSKFCPHPAKLILVNSQEEFSPLSRQEALQGPLYSMYKSC